MGQEAPNVFANAMGRVSKNRRAAIDVLFLMLLTSFYSSQDLGIEILVR